MDDPSTQASSPPASEAVARATYESLYLRLVLRGIGVDPRGFRFWKIAHRQGRRFTVWVFGRGSAAHYDVPESESWTSLLAQDLKSGKFALGASPPLDKQGLETMRRVAHELTRSGVPGALAILNARVPHRFTAVYRLKDGVMCNLALFDKEKSLDTFALQEVPLTDSFCQFALKEGYFATTQSGQDPRLQGHAYAGVVGSYIGVPIAHAKTGLLGTLCHFDFADHPIEEQEFRLLQRAAGLLPPFV